MANEFGTLAVATAATGAGAAVDVSHLKNLTVTLGGTFVATYALEFTMDGTTWAAGPVAAKTTPGTFDISLARVKMIRINCTAFTSGQGVAGYGGERV